MQKVTNLFLFPFGKVLTVFNHWVFFEVQIGYKVCQFPLTVSRFIS